MIFAISHFNNESGVFAKLRNQKALQNVHCFVSPKNFLPMIAVFGFLHNSLYTHQICYVNHQPKIHFDGSSAISLGFWTEIRCTRDMNLLELHINQLYFIVLLHLCPSFVFWLESIQYCILSSNATFRSIEIVHMDSLQRFEIWVSDHPPTICMDHLRRNFLPQQLCVKFGSIKKKKINAKYCNHT